MSELFRMKVCEVFKLSDGTVVLAGTVMEGPNFIHAGLCNLSVAGQDLGRVKLDGERMNGGTHSEIRSVDISLPLSFNVEELKNQEAIFAYQNAP